MPGLHLGMFTYHSRLYLAYQTGLQRLSNYDSTQLPGVVPGLIQHR